MAVLYELPGGAVGEVAFDAATKVTGAGQAVSYSYASEMAGQAGDVLFTINNTNNTYLSVPFAQQTERIRARYHINPAGMTFGAADQYNLTYWRGTSFTNRTHRMYIGNLTSAFGILPLSYAEGNTDLQSTFIPVDKQEMWIEEEFIRSSGVGVNDADYLVWVNDTLVYQRSVVVAPFINYTSFGLVNQCWFGGVSEIDAGTSGTFTFGKFIITNNDSLIGPYILNNPLTYLRRRRRD